MLQWYETQYLLLALLNELLKIKHYFSQWYLQYNEDQNVKLKEWI